MRYNLNRLFICALLFLLVGASFVSAGSKLPEELSANVYSNVCECLKYAMENEDSKLYVEAIRGYTGALAHLTPLAAELAKKKEKTVADREQLGKLNKLITLWRHKLDDLEAPAQLEAYETLKSDYKMRLIYLKEALKFSSPIIIQTNFFNCLAAYERTRKQARNVRLEYTPPEDLDPYYRQVSRKLGALMEQEAEASGFSENQIKIMGRLSSDTNLLSQLELAKAVLEGGEIVTPREFDLCYELLTFKLPLNYTYWQAWGDLRLRTGDTNGALRVWKKALSRFKNDFDLRYLLAFYSPQSKEGAEEACEYLRDCLEMTSGITASRIALMLARRYTQLGEYGEAYAAAQDSAKLARLSRSPNSSREYREARLFASDLAMRYGLLEAALENLEKLSANDEWDQTIAEGFAKVRYAMFMQKPEDKELLRDALKAFDKWGAFNPNQKGVCSAKAVMLYTAGQFKEAKAQAFKELSVSPADPSALTVLGHMTLREGKTAEAKAYFEAALRSDPEYGKAAEGLRACGQ
ncbi:hypothetical protein IKW72_07890 [bacterium]|nr:hypothetical protein [bacterium]